VPFSSCYRSGPRARHTTAARVCRGPVIGTASTMNAALPVSPTVRLETETRWRVTATGPQVRWPTNPPADLKQPSVSIRLRRLSLRLTWLHSRAAHRWNGCIASWTRHALTHPARWKDLLLATLCTLALQSLASHQCDDSEMQQHNALNASTRVDSAS